MYFISEWGFIKPLIYKVSAYQLIKIGNIPLFKWICKNRNMLFSFGKVKQEDLEDVEIPRYGPKLHVCYNSI